MTNQHFTKGKRGITYEMVTWGISLMKLVDEGNVTRRYTKNLEVKASSAKVSRMSAELNTNLTNRTPTSCTLTLGDPFDCGCFPDSFSPENTMYPIPHSDTANNQHQQMYLCIKLRFLIPTGRHAIFGCQTERPLLRVEVIFPFHKYDKSGQGMAKKEKLN